MHPGPSGTGYRPELGGLPIRGLDPFPSAHSDTNEWLDAIVGDGTPKMLRLVDTTMGALEPMQGEQNRMQSPVASYPMSNDGLVGTPVRPTLHVK